MEGLDVARGLAVLGMVLANFRGKAGAVAGELDWLMPAASRAEGKAAALFVVLAGVGISLRSRRARLAGDLRAERIALLDRAGVLLILGLLLLHAWSYDILHMYGLYLAVAAALLGVRSRTLVGIAVLFVLGGMGLQLQLDWWAPTDRWTWAGGLSKVLFNGNYPLFPWMALLLLGMWLGRQDLRTPQVRRPILAVSLLVLTIGVSLDEMVRAAMAADHAAPWMDWARAFPRPARPGFIAVGGAGALVVTCLCIAAAERRTDAHWVRALGATGQLAFTLYAAHTIAILIPLEHGLLRHSRIELVYAYGLAFYAASILAATWWRRRWPQGPLEGLIRQFTGRRDSGGPWSEAWTPATELSRSPAILRRPGGAAVCPPAPARPATSPPASGPSSRRSRPAHPA